MALKASARNWILTLSRTENSRNNPKSTLTRPGPLSDVQATCPEPNGCYGCEGRRVEIRLSRTGAPEDCRHRKHLVGRLRFGGRVQ